MDGPEIPRRRKCPTMESINGFRGHPGGLEYAKVGQVYGASLFGNGTSPGQYQKYQDIPWNTQWLAIGFWNGIVW